MNYLNTKLFLNPEEPLAPSTSLPIASLINSLQNSRQAYLRQLEEHSKAPDGLYDDATASPGPSISEKLHKATRDAADNGNLETNNPLSLHDKVCCLRLNG